MSHHRALGNGGPALGHQPRRVTVIEDEVARVDMSIDSDGDLEFATWFREGNRWTMLALISRTSIARYWRICSPIS